MNATAVRRAACLLAASSGAVAAAGPAAIPFTLSNDNIVVDVELKPGLRLPFVFDSGLSDNNILSFRTAEKLGVHSKGQARFKDSSGASGSSGLVTFRTMRLGEAMLTEQSFAIVDVPSEVTERPEHAEIAGFIGAPLLEQSILCIDYQQNVVLRWQRRDFDGSGLSSIPMKLSHGLPTISLKLDGLHATLIIDSGNNGGVELFPAFSKTNHLRSKYPNLTLMAGTSGSGQSFDVLTGSADLVDLGSEHLLNVPMSLVAQAINPAWGIDGLAGFQLLSRLNPCLDSDGQKLYWKPHLR